MNSDNTATILHQNAETMEHFSNLAERVNSVIPKQKMLIFQVRRLGKPRLNFASRNTSAFYRITHVRIHRGLEF